MSNQDFVEMEKEMETPSTDYSEDTKISESVVSSKSECKLYFFTFFFFLCNKIIQIWTKVQK